jgi:hypothetical protein
MMGQSYKSLKLFGMSAVCMLLSTNPMFSEVAIAQAPRFDLDELIILADPESCSFNPVFETMLDGLNASKKKKPMPPVQVPPEYADRFGVPELSLFDGGGGWITVPMTGKWRGMSISEIYIWQDHEESHSWSMGFAIKPSALREVMTKAGFHFDQIFDNGQAWANLEHSYIGIAPDYENPGITKLTCAVIN